MDYTVIVQGISDLHGVPNMDKEYVLFYDETNNARVFRLKDESFNFDEKAYFILGGLGFEKGKLPTQDSIETLFMDLQVSKSSDEVKFKHIQQGAKDFISLMSKSRVQKFIQWLYDNDYWIHYYYQDNFYFSVVDIIDSLDESTFGGFEFSRALKNTLYKYLNRDKDWFIQLMIYFDYPNIKDHEGFINEVINWIESIQPTSESDEFHLEYVKQSIKSYRKKNLLLLENNIDKVLIQNFKSIYDNAILTFYNSEHIFDEELEIQKLFEQESVEVFGKVADYKFINSRDSKLVQLSDLTVGILRIWLSFLEKYSFVELQELLSNLNHIQKQTMGQLQVVMQNSMRESFGFKHGTGSDTFELKINLFLEYDFGVGGKK
ncbi:DUF3800 domain-containing protein [Streptococcus orisasini]|uniref:DUF3800 domain-containing protein n=1 Tax=Streptococcus orisasini TaxID=1080071 RepID=UPI000A49123B|nr:DUF3800 domain-containing protein [Streptococcus orisasini]